MAVPIWDQKLSPTGLSHLQAWSHLLGIDLEPFVPPHVDTYHRGVACPHAEPAALDALREYHEHPGSALDDYAQVYALCLTGPQACDYVRTSPILRLCCGMAIPDTDIVQLLHSVSPGHQTAQTENSAHLRLWPVPLVRSHIIALVVSGALTAEGLGAAGQWYSYTQQRGGALRQVWRRGVYGFALLARAQMSKDPHEGARAMASRHSCAT